MDGIPGTASAVVEIARSVFAVQVVEGFIGRSCCIVFFSIE
jgi:hypothetical protein